MSKDRDDHRPPAIRRGEGYRRPPTASRFRPGQSGNPSGRPKGAPSVQELVAREASRLVKMKTPDGIESIPKQEAMVRQLFTQALHGNLQAVRLILYCLDDLGKSSAEASEDAIDPSKIDDEALKRMLNRFADYGAKDGDEK